MQGWQHKGGLKATRIDVGQWIWVVDQGSDVLYTENSAWINSPAWAILAQDVGEGWGKIWIAGSNPPYDIQRLPFRNPLAWDPPISVPGGAKRIDVDLHGNPWGSRAREIGQDVSNRSDGAGCPVKWA